MMHFIPWVVFLLLVVLSVPIAAWLEKRKMRAAYGDHLESEDESGDEQGDVAEADVAEADEAEAGEVEVVFGEEGGAFAAEGDAFGVEGGEDLSAFDDFK